MVIALEDIHEGTLRKPDQRSLPATGFAVIEESAWEGALSELEIISVEVNDPDTSPKISPDEMYSLGMRLSDCANPSNRDYIVDLSELSEAIDQYAQIAWNCIGTGYFRSFNLDLHFLVSMLSDRIEPVLKAFASDPDVYFDRAMGNLYLTEPQVESVLAEKGEGIDSCLTQEDKHNRHSDGWLQKDSEGIRVSKQHDTSRLKGHHKKDGHRVHHRPNYRVKRDGSSYPTRLDLLEFDRRESGHMPSDGSTIETSQTKVSRLTAVQDALFAGDNGRHPLIMRYRELLRAAKPLEDQLTYLGRIDRNYYFATPEAVEAGVQEQICMIGGPGFPTVDLKDPNGKRYMLVTVPDDGMLLSNPGALVVREGGAIVISTPGKQSRTFGYRGASRVKPEVIDQVVPLLQGGYRTDPHLSSDRVSN